MCEKELLVCGKTAQSDRAIWLRTAGDIENLAVDGGHPEVGGAGVEDDGEGLAGGSDVDRPVVLSLWTREGGLVGKMCRKVRGKECKMLRA